MPGQCASSGAANTRARNEALSVLFCTSIQEEEEEDLVERPSPASSQRAEPLLTDLLPGPSPDRGHNRTSVEVTGGTAYRVSKPVSSVITGVASATARLWGRLLRRCCLTPFQAQVRQGVSQRRCCGAAAATFPSAPPAPTFATASDVRAVPLTSTATQWRPATFQQLQSNTVTHAPPRCPPPLERPMPAGVAPPPPPQQQQQQQQKQRQQRLQFGHHSRPPPPHQHQRQQGLVQRQPPPPPQRPVTQQQPPQQAQSPQPPSPPRCHLVRLMGGNDVRLALQALQLAAQVHDLVGGPEGKAGDAARSREAVLEAASPLYDMAMSAARAIQHRALHSLVKQAVRRYVNPRRGSPDDVMRVILELLTGCGGKAAAAAATAAPPPLQRARAERLRAASGFSGVAITSQRSVREAAASAASFRAGNRVAGGTIGGPRRCVSTEPPPESSCGIGTICCNGGEPGAIGQGANGSELGGGGGSGSSCGGARGSTSSLSGSGSISGWEASRGPNGRSCSSSSGGGGGGGAGSCDSGGGRSSLEVCGIRPSLGLFGKHG